MKKLFKKLLLITAAFCSLQSLQAGWTPPVIIPAEDVPLSLQYDPSNNLLVSWSDRTTSPQTVKAAFLSPLGVLSPPVTLSPDTAVTPYESVNPATGDAIVAWSTPSNTLNATIIQAATYLATSQTWFPLQTIDTAPMGSGVGQPLVSLSPTGKGVACWIEDNGMGNQIAKAATLNTIPGTWSAAFPLPISAFGGTNPILQGVVIADNGPYAAVMWLYQDVGMNEHYHVEVFSALTNTWTVALDQISVFNKANCTLKVDNSGNVAFIGETGGLTNQILGWGTGELLIEVLSSVDSSEKNPLVVDNAGRAYAVWFTPNSVGDPTAVLHEKTFFFNAIPKQWSPDTPLNAPFIDRVAITPDALGNLYITTVSEPTMNSQIQTATFTAGGTPLVGGTWSPLVTTSQFINNDLSDRPIAANAAGAVLLSWTAVMDPVTNPEVLLIQEVHKNAVGSFTSLLNVITNPDVDKPQSNSYISSAGNKAIVFLALSVDGPIAYLTVFIDDLPPAVNPNPPTNFFGLGGKNKFLTQTEHFTTLTWTASTSPTVVAYELYSNGVLVAVIPATSPLIYQVHNINKRLTYTYTLFAVDALGNRSLPATITLP